MTRRFLDEVWQATEYIDHKCWENAAVIGRLGYQLAPPVRLASPIAMSRRTRILPTEGNGISASASPISRIVHFPGGPLPERFSWLLAAVEQLGNIDGAPSS